MSNATFRLADKIGNEFWFDQAGRLTDMLLSPKHRIRIGYDDNTVVELARPPYALEPPDRERVRFLNAMLPKRMAVKNLVNGTKEILVFNGEGRIAGYKPDAGASQRYEMLAILSDGSFRLALKTGHEIAFDAGGTFERFLRNSKRAVVKSMSMGDQSATFDYTVDASGELVTNSATVSEAASRNALLIRYEYDEEGRLAGVSRAPARGPESASAN
jgi:hypothetical protein